MSMTLKDVVGHAVRLIWMWSSGSTFDLALMVTGDVATYIKGNFFRRLSILRLCSSTNGGISPALQTHISSFILSNADQHNEVQPKQIRNVKTRKTLQSIGRRGTAWQRPLDQAH